MKAKVSVILPSLNVVHYIRECMDSVISQSLSELEIICIDAGSVDGTREILNEYARKDSRITVLESGIKSYGRQVNMGLDYASGEYIAVLETDDWSVQNMYQCLYEYASKDYLDYVAADFDMFYQLQNGTDYFVRQRLFGKNKLNWYGKILYSEQLATLRASDYVLWRGIYNREFLNVNHIRLHESPGAAFQDMGFLQQVKTYAKRAEYIDRSFYRYRQGREGASSNALEGLRYYKNEFQWINDQLKLTERLNGIHKKYYYYTMSISLITKYEQTLIGLNGNWQDNRLNEPYLWFKEQITKAIEEEILNKELYEETMWEKLMLLFASQKIHAEQVMKLEAERKKCVQEFLIMTERRPIVIFGCGIRGERLMLFCNKNHIDLLAFCDNNAEIQGGRKFGFPIIAPEELRKCIQDNNAAIILSMKKDTDQVYAQLVHMGIEEDRIISDIPEGIL